MSIRIINLFVVNGSIQPEALPIKACFFVVPDYFATLFLRLGNFFVLNSSYVKER